MSFGKYDSDYSALKALAFAVGVTMPDGGWDSSYSIMSSMYEYLVGTAPAEGASLMSMVDDIQTGVETGEIVIQDNCINEIERLNGLIADLQNQLKNCGEGGGGGSVTPSSDPLNDLFGVIGYNDENADALYDSINTEIEWAENIMNMWDVNIEDRTDQFYLDTTVVYFPQVDMSRTVNATSMFQYCTNLKFVPTMDLSACSQAINMFQGCRNLISASFANTDNIQSVNGMFGGCENLKSVKMGDLSGSYDANGMFSNCQRLVDLPDFSSMTNVSMMQSMFSGCTDLFTVPYIHTSNVYDMSSCFMGAGIGEAPSWNTSNVTNMGYMFYNCMNLTSIPEYDCSKVENIDYICDSSSNLMYLGGFKGLKVSLQLRKDSVPSLTYESIMNVINKLGTANEGAYLELGEYLNDLTDDDKVIAINKGWTLN